MLRKLLAASCAAAVVVGVVGVSPASADPAVAVFVGNATVAGPGLYFPVVGPEGNNLAWSFTASTALPAGPVSGSGNAGNGGGVTGYCGTSTGSGIATIGTHTGPIRWTSVGGTIILTNAAFPSTNSGHVAVSIIQARPLPTGTQIPCVTQGATNFTIVGVAATA